MIQEIFDGLVSKKLEAKPITYAEAATEVLEDMEYLGIDMSKEYNNYITMLSQ